MVWTWLRSCYPFTMRLFIDGVETEVPARWFYTVPGAKQFPFPHGCEASAWLTRHEVNPYWGEVTPYPLDPEALDSRHTDRGQNPGYQGQCYVGQDSWFIDGQLPAFSSPPDPLPECCFRAPATSAGGLVLSGVGDGHAAYKIIGTPGFVERGSLVLAGPGGAAAYIATGQLGFVETGSLVLDGHFDVTWWINAGLPGLVLNGSYIVYRSVPGTTCESGGTFFTGVDYGGSVPPDEPIFFFVQLVAGQLYNAGSILHPPLFGGGQLAVWKSPCPPTVLVAQAPPGACVEFTVPATGTYILEWSLEADPGTLYRLFLNEGHCPPP